MPDLKKKHLILLSLLSALLLGLAWPLRGFPFLIFIALIPLLMVVEQIRQNPGRFRLMATFRYSYITFLFWNAATTYWIWNSTEIGALFAIFVNSLLMALVVQLSAFIRHNLKNNIVGIAILPVLWIAFEFLHQDWDLSWTWLTFGNVFASRVSWVQWYEFTGVHGGSLWIWVINILLFQLIAPFLSKKKMCVFGRNFLIAALFLTFALPSTWSLWRYYSYEEKQNPVDIVLLQPNLNPYTEEYTLKVHEVMDRLFTTQTKSIVDSTVDFIVAPESVLQEGMFEDEFQYSLSVRKIKEFLVEFAPQSQFVSGAGTFRMLKPNEPITAAARRYNSHSYYEAFNTAMFLDSLGIPVVYHKSKLVAGVEQMPFVHLIKPIEKLAIDLGGTVGTLGKSKDRTVYTKGKVPVSAVICYESVYGEFVTEFVANGAQIIFVITNDGWWKNTGGHRQHFVYSRLRAVETRRSVARAANTGISCFINQRGDVIQQTQYWTRDVIRNKINANDVITFYVRHGDYIGRAMTVVSGILMLIALLLYAANRIGHRKTHLKG
ncbi:MAG: apolipoprotein N-acyltransferase [Bacteroidetes bacterium GWF2_43_63]|nr:MAG: apolipoprotein N-acyltransferase [Bacteroidetes bacterium GWE2_42_42]OFY55180.1 MAG: apolipoprotein N-acyltransferase [Bacteroidetes bacterium GWF2_43_63]